MTTLSDVTLRRPGRPIISFIQLNYTRVFIGRVQ